MVLKYYLNTEEGGSNWKVFKYLPISICCNTGNKWLNDWNNKTTPWSVLSQNLHDLIHEQDSISWCWCIVSTARCYTTCIIVMASHPSIWLRYCCHIVWVTSELITHIVWSGQVSSQLRSSLSAILSDSQSSPKWQGNDFCQNVWPWMRSDWDSRIFVADHQEIRLLCNVFYFCSRINYHWKYQTKQTIACTVKWCSGVDRNLQQHHAVSVWQHGFLVNLTAYCRYVALPVVGSFIPRLPVSYLPITWEQKAHNWREGCHQQQGPWNLYVRDGKFRPTFKSWREKRIFSVPLLMTWCPENAPNYTDLNLYFPKISGDNTLGLPKLGRG